MFKQVLIILALAVASVLANGQQILPSANQGGVWIPNPVNSVRQRISHAQHKLTAHAVKERVRQKVRQQVPGVHKIENIIRAVRYK